jgi:hypothetical protein
MKNTAQNPPPTPFSNTMLRPPHLPSQFPLSKKGGTLEFKPASYSYEANKTLRHFEALQQMADVDKAARYKTLSNEQLDSNRLLVRSPSSALLVFGVWTRRRRGGGGGGR